jgi:hypothetical protein
MLRLLLVRLSAEDLGQVEVAECVQAVRHGDDHHVVRPGEFRAVVEDGIAGAGPLAAAVEPDHDRPPASPRRGRRPDVQP